MKKAPQDEQTRAACPLRVMQHRTEIPKYWDCSNRIDSKRSPNMRFKLLDKGQI